MRNNPSTIKHNVLFLTFVLWNVLIFTPQINTALGYSNNNEITVTRQMSDQAMAGETITIEISLNVGTGIIDPIRGLYFTDQIPDDFLIDADSTTATLNKTNLTNITVEIGNSGGVYPGIVPYSIISETPPVFSEDNYLTAGDELIVSYEVTVPHDAVPGTVYTFSGHNWVGRIISNPAEDIFGYDDEENSLEVLPGSTAPCPVESIYGNNSKETVLVRNFRDTILSTTPEGQKLISLYYTHSLTVIKLIENDPEFKNNLKALIDTIILLNRKSSN